MYRMVILSMKFYLSFFYPSRGQAQLSALESLSVASGPRAGLNSFTSNKSHNHCYIYEEKKEIISLAFPSYRAIAS